MLRSATHRYTMKIATAPLYHKYTLSYLKISTLPRRLLTQRTWLFRPAAIAAVSIPRICPYQSACFRLGKRGYIRTDKSQHLSVKRQ